MKIAFALLVVVLAAITVLLAVKSCQLSPSEQLKKENRTHEATIKAIQAKRDTANADTVPFSDSKRTKVVESVNDKTGFDLSVRPQKAN